MPRQSVIEVTCSRCGKTETQKSSKVFNPPDSKKDWVSEEGDPIECSFRFRDNEVSYEDLCERCRETISNIFLSVSKVTPETRAKGGKKKEDDPAPTEKREKYGNPPGFEKGKRGAHPESVS